MLDDIYPKVVPGPPKPSMIVQPRVFSMPPGTERYVVEGCGAILVRIEAGDRIEIQNTEGGQPAEIVATGPDGKGDPAILGTGGQGAPVGLMALMQGDDQSLRALRMGVQARDIDLAQCQAQHLFGSTTPAGDAVEFTATRDGVVIIAAPHPNASGIMDFELQDTATPLTVLVRRAVVKRAPRFALPDPLADPVADIRIHTQTAQSYFVKAGDFIQVIDVDGRQCTDFQCFDARKLDRGG